MQATLVREAMRGSSVVVVERPHREANSIKNGLMISPIRDSKARILRTPL